MLQTPHRDTMKFAMKASAIRLADGAWRDVFKDPVTDHGKVSKKGRLAVVEREERVRTIREGERAAREENLLEDVFVDGRLVREESFAEIRSRANG